MRNLETPRHNSEQTKHHKHHPNHYFTWKKLHVQHFSTKRIIVEGLFIKQKNATLNKQVKCFHCNLFPFGT